MNAFGYAFLLMGVLLIRQVVTGRVMETPTDARDLALALLNADTAGVSAVLSRRGENVTVSSSEVATGDTVTVPTPQSQRGGDLIAEMQRLGSAASGYRLGSNGPEYYDCSSLVWRAAKNLGIYNGPRFTTSIFSTIAKGWAYRVPSPAAGDIVLWPGKHMGVYLGNDKMYSARSRTKGIGTSTVSGDSGYFGSQPSYWRIANLHPSVPKGAV